MSILRPTNVKEGLIHTLVLSQTRPLRLILCLVNLLIAVSIIFLGDKSNYAFLLVSIPMDIELTRLFWASSFILHACALLKGISGRYNLFTLMVEGVFGWCIWTWAAIVAWAVAGIPTVLTAGIITMTWILVRYPTHWTSWGRRDVDPE